MENVLEKLRPLVGENGWDYLVVWKLGDYSTRLRYMEMMGCCCAGATRIQVNAEDHLLQACKDLAFPHPKRSIACEALASVPLSIPLSFGIHVLVLVSGQPRWITPDESNGTRVLIPILGGLIEFFAIKQIPIDYQMIELITVHCNEENEANFAYMDNCKPDEGEQFLTLPFTMNNHPFLDRPLPGSVPLVESQSFTSSLKFEPGRVRGSDCSALQYLLPTQYEYSNTTRPLNGVDSNLACNRKDYLNDLCKREGLSQRSRNLLVERNRRNKLKSKILCLRSLVPNITKMDIQSTLGDACSYITELQTKVKALQDEIKELEDEEAMEHVENQKTSSATITENRETCNQSPSSISTNGCHDTLTVTHSGYQVEENFEVNECGSNKFYLKLIFRRNRCWFQRLMETVNALGLVVTEANIITIDGTVMNIFTAEAKTNELEAEQLKASIIELMQNLNVNLMGSNCNFRA